MPTNVKNLATDEGLPELDWSQIETRLDAGLANAPDEGGPNRYTSWLVTINPDGSPHVTSVGAIWVNGAFWFQTGDATRKARNIARDPRCSLSFASEEFDLVASGEAEKVTDPATVRTIAEQWAAGGWPCQPDDSGTGITAPFNAPAVGPAPWYVYRLTPDTATAVSTVEPGGSTKWTFSQ